MNNLRIKFALITIFALGLLVLALPEFSFNLGGREFTYPSVGFSKIGLGVDFASFKKGEDVFASERFSAQVSFPEETELQRKIDVSKEILEKIEARIEHSGLTGIAAQYRIESNGEVFIDVTIPENYENRDTYAEFLTKQGEIEFYAIATSQPEANRISIEDYHVEEVGVAQSIDLNTQRFKVPNLVLRVQDEKLVQVRQIDALLSGATASEEEGLSARAGINIDGVQTLDIVADENNQTVIRGVLNTIEIPFDYDPSGKFINDILLITQSYFFEQEPISQQIDIQAGSVAVPPTYNAEGATFISWMLIASILISLVYILNKQGIAHALDNAILTGYTYLIAIIFAKLLQAPISLGLVLAFVVYYLVMILINSKLLKITDKDKYSFEKMSLRNTLIISLFTLVIVTKLSTTSSMLVDFVGGIIVLVISNLFALYTVIPVLSQRVQKRFAYKDLFRK